MVKKTATKNIYRSEENRIIAGICGGLGEYFNIDPVIIRIIFFLLSFFGGSGIPIYLVLWLIIPNKSRLKHDQGETMQENIEEIKTKAKEFAEDVKSNSQHNNTKRIFGIITMFVGVIFLLENFGFYFLNYLWRFWPLLIIILGFLIITKNERK